MLSSATFFGQAIGYAKYQTNLAQPPEEKSPAEVLQSTVYADYSSTIKRMPDGSIVESLQAPGVDIVNDPRHDRLQIKANGALWEISSAEGNLHVQKNGRPVDVRTDRELTLPIADDLEIWIPRLNFGDIGASGTAMSVVLGKHVVKLSGDSLADNFAPAQEPSAAQPDPGNAVVDFIQSHWPFASGEPETSSPQEPAQANVSNSGSTLGAFFGNRLRAETEKSQDASTESAGEVLFLPEQFNSPGITPGDPTQPAISYNDVRQGSIGDCYFLASLAAVARQHPELIAQNVRPNRDGTYTVTFYERHEERHPWTLYLKPDVSYKPVEVTVGAEDFRFDKKGDPINAKYGDIKILAGARGSWANTTQREIWPRVYEAAYAKWKGGFDKIDNDTKANGDGILNVQALQELTGRDGSGALANLPLILRQSPQGIRDALRRGEVMVAGTIDKDGQALGSDADPLFADGTLLKNHAYALIDVTEDDKVVVFDPHNETRKPIELSFDQFRSAFSGGGIGTHMGALQVSTVAFH